MPGNWLGGSNLAQEQVVVEGKEAKDEVVIYGLKVSNKSSSYAKPR
jgi:hypothetical protein